MLEQIVAGRLVKCTNKSFQNKLSSVSSEVSSSVTPPNRIPVDLFAHNAIVAPDLSEGA